MALGRMLLNSNGVATISKRLNIALNRSHSLTSKTQYMTTAIKPPLMNVNSFYGASFMKNKANQQNLSISSSNSHFSTDATNFDSEAGTVEMPVKDILKDFEEFKKGKVPTPPDPHGQHPSMILYRCADSRSMILNPGKALFISTMGAFFQTGDICDLNVDSTFELAHIKQVKCIVFQGHGDCGAADLVAKVLGLIPSESSQDGQQYPKIAKWQQQPLAVAEKIIQAIIDGDYPNMSSADLCLAIKANKPIEDPELQAELKEVIAKGWVAYSMEKVVDSPLQNRILNGETKVHGLFYNLKENCIEVYNPSNHSWHKWSPSEEFVPDDYYHQYTPSTLTPGG